MRNPVTQPDDLQALVHTNQKAVFRMLYRLTGPGDHLEDLAQEVFLRLFRGLPEFRGEAELSTYLYRITYNVAQDEWKRRRREREHRTLASPDTDADVDVWLDRLSAESLSGQRAPDPEQVLAKAEIDRVVEQGLAALPVLERTALVLYHAENLSYEAIATTMALPVNTVRTHLHRGRKRLTMWIQQRLACKVHPTVGAADPKALPGRPR